jgi:hypothetical protein
MAADNIRRVKDWFRLVRYILKQSRPIIGEIALTYFAVREVLSLMGLK